MIERHCYDSDFKLVVYISVIYLVEVTVEATRWSLDKTEETVTHLTFTDLVGNGAEVLLQPAMPVSRVVLHRLELNLLLVHCSAMSSVNIDVDVGMAHTTCSTEG